MRVIKFNEDNEEQTPVDTGTTTMTIQTSDGHIVVVRRPGIDHDVLSMLGMFVVPLLEAYGFGGVLEGMSDFCELNDTSDLDEEDPEF
jgi:hypothetical protein